LKTKSSQRARRWAALLLLIALPAISAYARPHHSEAWARERFAAAERMREALNGRKPADRSRRDYQRVLNAYRSVYYGAPSSPKADPSVVAVAETLVEMGRRFDDDKILHAAIGQYKFLRREYPGSKYRCDALFTIGEIYNDDLNDREQARATFEDFLRRYPHNRLAEDAQQAIADLDRQASKKGNGEKKPRNEADVQNQPAPELASKDSPNHAKVARESADQTSEQPPNHLPRVTGIRHWSTPDYTRVAIDLEGTVKYGSERIPHPDRIFFDLRNTKLASTLVGKTFDIDDGFLKKIRVAQFKPGRTRVVLEVDSLSDYDAFLLPDPYRLIVDIHGKSGHRRESRKGSKTGAEVKDATAPQTASGAESSANAEANTSASDADAAESKPQRLVADAGKAPVLSQDVGDATRVEPKSEKPPQEATADKQTSSVTRETATVTKVVVEADDEDSHPARRHKKTVHARAKTPLHPNTDDSDSFEADVREASPTSHGDRSLIRALGLKIGKIVIDPGHGGHDTGTIGPNGLEEKDLVLEVGRRLGKLLESRLGAEVVYTRKDDTFIPLETRTAIANQQRADLFISIHANSSQYPDARGVETYYLNFTSSPDALEVAARENAVSEKSIYELQDLVKKIALKEKIEESREFATDVQESLHSGLATKSPSIRNRGVKKAPFIVLIGANMPSILAEISFVSNPTDERRLETSEYRQRIAESLYRGVAKYVNGLSGVKVASKVEKISGQ
jgi:N-acetylmuramoyl-L-alanine amidase